MPRRRSWTTGSIVRGLIIYFVFERKRSKGLKRCFKPGASALRLIGLAGTR